MTQGESAYDGLLDEVTALFARHDPAWILTENPDAPQDEYEDEAEEVLRKMASRAGSDVPTLKIVETVFKEAFDEWASSGFVKRAYMKIVEALFQKELDGKELLSSRRLREASEELDRLVKGEASAES